MDAVTSNALLICALGAVLWAAVQRARTADLYGSDISAAAKRFRQLQWMSDMWWVRTGAAIAVAIIVLVAAPRVGLLGQLEIIGVALLAIAIVHVLTALRPPSVLFLASSIPESRQLFGQISRDTSYRVVALLEPETRWVRRLLYFTNGLRTRQEGHWRTVVEQLARIVPLVVLDTRGETPGVAHEARFLFSTDLHRRTLFVSRADGSLPALKMIGEPASHRAIQHTTPDACVHVVRSRLDAYARTVSLARPPATLAEAARLGFIGGCCVGAGYALAALVALAFEIRALPSYFGRDDGIVTIALPELSQRLAFGTMPLFGIALSRIIRRRWWLGAPIPWLAVVVPLALAYFFRPESSLAVALGGVLLAYAMLGATLGLLLEPPRWFSLALASIAAYILALIVTLVLTVWPISPFVLTITTSRAAGELAIQAFSQSLTWPLYGAAMGMFIQWVSRR